MKLDAEFSFAVRLGMLHYSLWEMPVRGRTVTRNLNIRATCWVVLGSKLFWTTVKLCVGDRCLLSYKGAIIVCAAIYTSLLQNAVRTNYLINIRASLIEYTTLYDKRHQRRPGNEARDTSNTSTSVQNHATNFPAYII